MIKFTPEYAKLSAEYTHISYLIEMAEDEDEVSALTAEKNRIVKAVNNLGRCREDTAYKAETAAEAAASVESPVIRALFNE